MLTVGHADDDRSAAASLFAGWIKLCHARARRRDGAAFREAADIQDLWRWLQANVWREGAA